MGLLDFLSSGQASTPSTGGLLSDPNKLALLQAGANMLSASQGAPGGPRPTLAAGLGAGLNGYIGGMQTAQQMQQQAMKAQFLKQQMEQEQAKRQALQGIIQSLPQDQQTLALAAPDKVLGAKVAEAFPKPADPTSDMTNYRLAQQQGYKGSFMDYKSELARSMRPQTNVNVSSNQPPLENSYDKARGAFYADEANNFDKAANDANGKIASLQMLGQALSNPDVYQGAGGATVLKLKNIAKSMGWDVQGVPDGQLAQALSSRMALDLRNPSGGAGMPGSMSNSDRQFLVNMTANLDNTPEANQKLISANIMQADRSRQVAKLAREYAAQHGGRLDANFNDQLAQWAEKNPMLRTITSKADYEAIPRGYMYVDGRTGNLAVKK